ncbi:MAG: RHS repeat-associated core domain-containing protein [Fluviicola sp.]
MKKIKLLGLLLIPFAGFSQPGKTFTEKLEGVSTSKKELTKNASTDNTSIGQGGAMTNSVPLVTVSSRTMSFPIQLQYAAGIKADQRSGPTGLGWVLPIGSITRDIGSYYPDYSSTKHEAQMLNVVDDNLPSDGNKGKFNTQRTEGNTTINGTYLDPAVQQKYLGFDAISNGLNSMPLSDMYHISVPGKFSNSFFNSGGVSQPHSWKLTEIENWKIAHTVKNFKVSQEFSRINELNLQRLTDGRPELSSSYASAIGMLPYVENGFARIALTNTSFVPSEEDRYVRYDDFEKFIITDENGTKYVFGRALRGQRYVFSDDPYWSNSLGTETFTGDKGSFWKIDYIAEWLLTEIQSLDYRDLNGNKIADDGDAGDWIRFEYTEATKTEPSYLGGSCYWYEQEVPKYREWSSYSQTDKASSLMRELAYLQKIVTPTQEIDFTISERYDVEHDYYTKPANRVGNDYYYENQKLCTTSSPSDFDINYPVETMKYDSIKVKSRLVNSELYPNENLQTDLIRFNYAAKGSSQELAVSKYLIRNNNKQEKVVNGSIVGSPSRTAAFNIEEYNNSADKRGKTTLLGLEFYGTNVSASQKTEYKFEYAYNPSFDEFHKREIVRAYYFPSVRQGHSQSNPVIPFTRADGLIPSYKEYFFNASGLPDSITRTNISPYDFLIDFPYKEANYKFLQSTSQSAINNYANGYQTNAEFDLYADYNPHGVNPIKDIYGYCLSLYPAASEAWSLTKITYPTGGEVSFKYEPATFTESPEWSIKPSNLPIITRYNEKAKVISYVQDAYNRRYSNDYNLNLSPKKLTFTFELDLPLNYGIRLKEKSSNDKINPLVKVSYEYENGMFTALPAEFIQNALFGFNQFVIRENHKHSIELGKYNLSLELSGIWDYDYAQKVSVMTHTNVALDDYSSTFFYKKIRVKGSDNSFIQREYGSTLTENIEFPNYKLYCTRLQGGSSWLGSYALGGSSLSVSPISLKSESYHEANSTIPYQKTTFSYERTGEVQFPLRFDYNGSNPGAGKVILWDVYFNVYKPKSDNNIPATTKYDWVRTLAGDTVIIHSNNIIGVASTDYTTPINYIKWMSSKTYLKKETVDYKGIVSETNYRYVKNTATENKYILRDIEKRTIGESVKYITRNKYAFENYRLNTSKFRDSNLISLPYQTITFLDDTLNNKVLATKVFTYDLSPRVPKILDSYQYETSVDPVTGVFTLPAFSDSDPNWRISETDAYEYNPAATPVSTRSNQLYTKVVTGNGMNTAKANIIGTERPFDATYSGFEDFTDLKLIEQWNNQSYLKEEWFTGEVQSLETTTKVVLTENGSSCANNGSFSSGGSGSGTLYYAVTTNDITNLNAHEAVTFYYTVGGTTTPVSLIIESFNPTIITDNSQALNYTVCFTTAPLPNINMTILSSKIVGAKPKSRLSNSYARTGKYSYKLASIRTSGEPSKRTPIRPVRIAPMTIATECSVPEGPGDGGSQSRNPNIPASCYWDYQASLWIKYDTDFPPMPATNVPSTPFSDDAQGDAIYRRGTVNTTTDQGVKIICKVWNNAKTSVIEEFVYYPQGLNAAWQQFTIDFSVFKGPGQWVEVFVENNKNQVGASIPSLQSAFVDDIIIAPKEARYDYNVTNALGLQTFKTNNNDVFIQSTFDEKGRAKTIQNAYGKILQEISYFDQANWTSSNNYVTEVEWFGNGLFNTARYFIDGFGRTKQVQNSDNTRNLRTVSETSIYNDKGQIIRTYKPYYLDQYGLATKYDAAFAAKTQTLYGSNYPYTDIKFEPKPESIVDSIFAPKTNSEGAIISSQREYMNTVVLTHVNSSGTSTFPIGTLAVHETVNPNGKITRTYMNRLGQVLMEEHQIGMNHNQNADGSISFNSTNLGFAQTWFYYDGAARLVATYDPENKKTSYYYNSLGILIKSTTPDRGSAEIRYDKYGQVRFTRNQKDIDAVTTGNPYGTSQFKYVKYDKWGKNIESGVVTIAPGNLGVSTTNPPFPTGDFFNDYSKINDQAYPKSTDKFVQVHSKNEFNGSRKFYNSTSITAQFAYSGHILNTTAYTYSPGKTDQINATYMADGQSAKTNYSYDGLAGIHQVVAVYNELNFPIGKDYINPVNGGQGFKWRSTLDNHGRVLKSYSIYNGITTEITRNFYDPLGNLLLSGYHATGISTNPYTEYVSIKKNIREQLVNQMSKNFRYGLTYDLVGNITNQYWSNEYYEPATTSETKINQYAYTYDKMNRLIGADYKQSTLTSNPFQYYSTLNGNIPTDFNCVLDGEVVALAFNPYYNEFESNIQNNIQTERSAASVNALRQFQSDYVLNNVQYSDMNASQIEAFLNVYITNCNSYRLKPTEFEYYEAEKEHDDTHLDFLKNNPLQPASLKYLKRILSSIPWTPPVNCMPNPNATAYGYLQNFPTPVASENSPKYDAAYWYQKNGNFSTLNRTDNLFTKTQQLYTYVAGTNKLSQTSFEVGYGAPGSVTSQYSYGFDVNGNLTSDPRNGVSSIIYSLFHDLPSSMTNSNGQRGYRYFEGQRSVKEVSSSDREYYIDMVVLDQYGTVKSYQTTVGYAIPIGGTAKYFIHLKDWLGNARVTLDVNGVIANVIDYYPYGKKLPGRQLYGTNNEGYRYQFTGHEMDGETGYQYHGARYYDEDLARYMSVDPLAMKYHAWSPYNYVLGNPIMLTDPTGMGPQGWIGKPNANGTATTYEYRADVNSEAELPAGYSSFLPDGSTIESTDGTFWRLGTNRADQISEVDHKANHGVFTPGRYYKLGTYGWEEAGIVEVGAVSAKEAATAELLHQYWQTQFRLEDYDLAHSYDYYLQAQAQMEQMKEMQYDFARTQNIFGLMYELSPASAVPDIVGNIQEGSYLNASGMFFLEFLPVDEAADALRANRRAFRSFKKLNGPAGPGMDWHHIVEQHANNVLKFGHEAIQNSDNLIRLDRNTHILVTSYYNSGRIINGVGYSRTRDYVKTLSFNEQREYGLQVMKQLGWTP